MDWDQALLDVIPDVRRARTAEQYNSALRRLLQFSGDPAAALVERDQPAAANTPAVRVENDLAIVSCNGMARSGDIAEVAAAADTASAGIIIDCRDLSGHNYALLGQLREFLQRRITSPLPAGAKLVRSYSGFPPEMGASSGGYASGVTLIDEAPLAAGSFQRMQRLVCMIDASAANVLPVLTAFQAAGRARIVSEGNVGSGLVEQSFGNRRLRMSQGIYVYPDGAVGFHADAIIPANDDAAALSIAISQLSGTTQRTPPSTARPIRQRRMYPNEGAPPVEQRLLALFRAWGVLNYFFPYRDLADRPWNGVLEDFIPVFVAADTRAKYEQALLRLAARMDDSHASISGLQTQLSGVAPVSPAFDARYIEGRLIVVRVPDPLQQREIHLGDEILAVDGTPIAQREAHLRPLLSASTAQALRGELAWRVLAGPRGSTARLRLRGGDGRLRTVDAMRARSRPSRDAWRMLEGNVGYIDLEVLTRANVAQAFADLSSARGLIFDLRSYPQGTFFAVSAHLASRPYPIVGATFRRPTYLGPPTEGVAFATAFDQFLVDFDVPRFTGPVYVLIDERAGSQAEHTGLFLEAATDVTFVGEPTSGVNGDVTSLQLPGDLVLRFTGHDVRWPDGRQLQRVGIQPDVPIAPTIAGVRAGRDEVLEAALSQIAR